MQTHQLIYQFHGFPLEAALLEPAFSELSGGGVEEGGPHPLLLLHSQCFSGPASLEDESPVFCKERQGHSRGFVAWAWNLGAQLLLFRGLNQFCFLPCTAKHTLFFLFEGACALISETFQASVLGISFSPVSSPLQAVRFLFSELS